MATPLGTAAAALERAARPTARWEGKVAAIAAVVRAAEVGPPGAAFTAEEMKSLAGSLHLTLKEKRTQVVKESCLAVVALCHALSGAAALRPLAREVMPTLVDLLASGNGVMQHAAKSCTDECIRHCPDRRILPPVLEAVSASRSKDVRDECTGLLRDALKSWSEPALKPARAQIEACVRGALSDSSAHTRAHARSAFMAIAKLWPHRAAGMAVALPARVSKLLPQPYGEAVLVPPAPPTPGGSSVADSSLGGGPRSPAPSARSRKPPMFASPQRQAAAAAAPPLQADRRHHREFAVGDRVATVSSAPTRRGVVRYVGRVHFGQEGAEWLGLELDAPCGLHDGSREGVFYFECRPRCGVFVPPHVVRPAGPAQPLPAEGAVKELFLTHRSFLTEQLAALRAEMAVLEAAEAAAEAAGGEVDTPMLVQYVKSVNGVHTEQSLLLDLCDDTMAGFFETPPAPIPPPPPPPPPKPLADRLQPPTASPAPKAAPGPVFVGGGGGSGRRRRSVSCESGEPSLGLGSDDAPDNGERRAPVSSFLSHATDFFSLSDGDDPDRRGVGGAELGAANSWE